ncbi:hypothetical protein WR25_19485 [Diploscapter pachys]|uniref:Uncharacterized protein n=1 Tax=Diploscapter pachys TaxID=2018661 RepID=A0A2A2K0N7_9BILA|nr:hypothetical protein WR25_19485 [Diploscapter pachys]
MGGRRRNIELPKPENLDVDSYGNVDQYPEGLRKLIAQNIANDLYAANNTKNPRKGYASYIQCPKSSIMPDAPPKCIKSTDLCNGVADCPGATDETPDSCLWHKLEQEQVQSLRSETYRIRHNRKGKKQESHHYVMKSCSREDDEENNNVARHKKHSRSFGKILNLDDDNSSMGSEY